MKNPTCTSYLKYDRCGLVYEREAVTAAAAASKCNQANSLDWLSNGFLPKDVAWDHFHPIWRKDEIIHQVVSHMPLLIIISYRLDCIFSRHTISKHFCQIVESAWVYFFLDNDLTGLAANDILDDHGKH